MGLLVGKVVLSGGTAGASEAEASEVPFVRISDLNTVMPWGGTKPMHSVAFNATAASTISILCGRGCWGCNPKGSGSSSWLSAACYNNLEVSTQII